MLNLYQAFDEIKKNPIILANSSIYSLDAYIVAYDDFRRALGFPITQQQQEFNLFLKWLKYEKYKSISTKTIRWSSLVLFYSDNERDALNNFFLLYDEFLALKNLQRNLNSPHNQT